MSYYNNIYDYLNAYELAQQQQQAAAQAASRRRRQQQRSSTAAAPQYGRSFYVSPSSEYSPFFYGAAPPASSYHPVANKKRSYAAPPQQNYQPFFYDFDNTAEDEDDNDEQVYTLEDILNLVNRHQSNNPEQYGLVASSEKSKEEQAAADEKTKEMAAEVAEEAAAVGAVREAAAEEEEAEEKAVKEEEKEEQEQGRTYGIADLIREAILAAQQEDEEEEEEAKKDKEEAKTENKTEDKSLTDDSKPTAAGEDSTAASFHLSAPSPVHDPLQVSQPQISSELPFSPQVDVYFKPDSLYKVVLSLPGANKNSFEIDFHPSNQELFIKGSTCNKDKLLSNSDDDLKYLKVSEINFGAFQRSVKFPSLPKVKDEEIKAKYSNGLLEITVPVVKPESAAVKPKKRVVVEEVEDEELKYEKGH